MKTKLLLFVSVIFVFLIFNTSSAKADATGVYCCWDYYDANSGASSHGCDCFSSNPGTFIQDGSESWNYSCGDACDPDSSSFCSRDCIGKCGGADDTCYGACYDACPSGQVCYNQACCTRDCKGKCGGASNGCDDYGCWGQCPKANQICYDYACCAPDCTGRNPSSKIPANPNYHRESFG
jgi:hypothetical protein